MTSLLILTVGTGTAGSKSNIAQGLANSLRKVQPRLFWLLPSASADSQTTADMIRESVTDLNAFSPVSDAQPYRLIGNPDDIHECRQVVRSSILQARLSRRPGELLVINPTSGTKQMSAGATLAALDEEVDRVDFTGGQRQNGVVMTGSEVIQSFDIGGFLFQRDLRSANQLFEQGAFQAAARLLESHQRPSNPIGLQALQTALCLHEWQRMNYLKASSHAAKFSQPLCDHLKMLASVDPLSSQAVGDLLAGADELLRWGDAEEALARYYRGAEALAKHRLAEAHGIQEKGLTAVNAWEMLANKRADPFGKAYFSSSSLHQLLQRRNVSVYGHGHEPVEPNLVRSVATELRALIQPHLPQVDALWTVGLRPRSLPTG